MNRATCAIHNQTHPGVWTQQVKLTVFLPLHSHTNKLISVLHFSVQIKWLNFPHCGVNNEKILQMVLCKIWSLMQAGKRDGKLPYNSFSLFRICISKNFREYHQKKDYKAFKQRPGSVFIDNFCVFSFSNVAITLETFCGSFVIRRSVSDCFSFQ